MWHSHSWLCSWGSRSLVGPVHLRRAASLFECECGSVRFCAFNPTTQIFLDTPDRFFPLPQQKLSVYYLPAPALGSRSQQLLHAKEGDIMKISRAIIALTLLTTS